MATKANCKCLDNSREDEPIFVLCARDRLAPATVRDWAQRAEHMKVNKAKVKEARECAQKMEAWQIMNASKLPD